MSAIQPYFTTLETPENHFPCGCVPYFSAFTYGAWAAYGRQVQRGQKAHRSADTDNRDRLFCLCQTSSVKPAVTTTTAPAVVSNSLPLGRAELTRLNRLRALKAAVEAEAAEPQIEADLLSDIVSAKVEKPIATPMTQPIPTSLGTPIGSLIARLGAQQG